MFIATSKKRKISKPKYISKNVVNAMYIARYVSYLRTTILFTLKQFFSIEDIHWRICSGMECSTCLLPCCVGHPRALEQGSSCQVKLSVYLSATQLCWSPQSIGARFLMPGKATRLPVCYPAVLVTPEHWSKVPHAR
jgi:hypothetical protein